jgi:hypothetical protein
MALPVEQLRLVTPFPEGKATMRGLRLSELCGKGKPLVLHLYTG